MDMRSQNFSEVISFIEPIDTRWPTPSPKCYSLTSTGLWLETD